jgi:phage shock protein PspC (stress-responsive transcriptional regulator)
MLGGVAGGIADYFGIDPVLVRLAFVALTLLGGAGPIGYVIAWIVVPEEPADGGDGRSAVWSWRGVRDGARRTDARQIIGFVLVCLGAMAALHRFGIGVRGDVAGPLALIGVGAAVLWSRRTTEPEDTGPRPPTFPTPSPPTPPIPPVPPTPTPTPKVERAREIVDGPGRAERLARRSRGRRLRGIVLGGLLVGGGFLAILLNATNTDGSAEAVLAGALTIVGLALVLGAWIGRPRGFIALGVMLTVAVAAASALDVEWRGGIGDRTYRPVAAAEVRRNYNVAIGQLSVDLDDVDFTGRRAEVDAEVGIGRLLVSVPDGVRVVVDARVGGGRSLLFGEEKDGFSVEDEAIEPGTSAGAGVLYLKARVGFGELEVAREGRFIGDGDGNFDGNIRVRPIPPIPPVRPVPPLR